MKEKLRSKSFWIGLVSAALVFLQAVGIKVDAPAVNEVVSSLLTVLVVLGIVSGGGQHGGGTVENTTSEKGKTDGAESDETSAEKGGES